MSYVDERGQREQVRKLIKDGAVLKRTEGERRYRPIFLHDQYTRHGVVVGALCRREHQDPSEPTFVSWNDLRKMVRLEER